MKVLIAYASAKGSTAEVAARIGHGIAERGHQVTVLDVREVQSLGAFDSVVMGSAVHTGVWLPEMSEFTKRFRHELSEKPVWLWLSCIRVLEQHGEEHVREHYVNSEVLKRMNLQEMAVFPGRLILDETDWNERWTLAARYDGNTWPSGFNGDFRDWKTIDLWAASIAAALTAQNV
jgi:menaquinone-dependent protoporphyrinogen oxidase